MLCKGFNLDIATKFTFEAEETCLLLQTYARVSVVSLFWSTDVVNGRILGCITQVV